MALHDLESDHDHLLAGMPMEFVRQHEIRRRAREFAMQSISRVMGALGTRRSLCDPASGSSWGRWMGAGFVVACHGSSVYMAMSMRLGRSAIEQIRLATVTENCGDTVIDRSEYRKLLQQTRAARRTSAVDVSRECPPPPGEAPSAEEESFHQVAGAARLGLHRKR